MIGARAPYKPSDGSGVQLATTNWSAVRQKKAAVIFWSRFDTKRVAATAMKASEIFVEAVDRKSRAGRA